MPVDYSKWDALELSDDSDIEVHPNVDKRSFIRAKQNQIHQQRFERKNQIETYKYERIVNDGLLRRISGLLSTLESHKAEVETRRPEDIFMQTFMETVRDAGEDAPPPPPAGVHTQEKETPTYSKMMAALVDQVQAKIKESKTDGSFDAYYAEVKSHLTKVEELQRQLLEELNKLEKEEGRKITSESIHTGFDKSFVAKSDPKPAPKTATKKEQVQAVEVLNPHALAAHDNDPAQSSGADADIDEPSPLDDDDDAEVEASELGKQFALIKMGDYRACLQFISEHPQVLAEKETDGLLVMAFNAAIGHMDDFARQCVHQGLLLQYCRALGRDGVGLFFKRITTQGHQAQKVFFDDVQSTYQRIRSRAKELEKQRAQEEADGTGGVEQIQLHAVDPGTTINIKIPPKTSEDPVEIEARKLFDAFPPGLQRALESGSLDEVNKVLGKMSVEEAEEVVGQLGEGGMLSLEEQIIDATTEEGQKALKEFEEQERAAAAEHAKLSDKYADDPE
ncbi:putative Hsp90 co-chaperone Cdc37 [Hyaloscypha variabilis F]|uniref:Hsp90 chaperone protein kinase-targeting subunit n=1 Tax=Hyaloscypha variabilis (strain UAMH 11265 / GT02V1 / F) TaxID=1149755 RepID=A0A2J6RPH8_HYAVF|nr:putative Hsp90 co-chaperone Cdc37 [Hyaloscypha variabilis F]